MKLIQALSAITVACGLLASPAFAGEKTCCEKAAADGKQCSHKCCATAHKDGKSCEKCNPNKEDLKLKKNQKKSRGTAKKDAES